MSEHMRRLLSHLMKNWVDHQWSKADQRRVRYLTAGMEAQRQAVMWSLLDHPVLLARMQACGTLDIHNNMQQCQVPLCPRCLMVRRGKETREAIRRVFASVPNEQLSMLTVLMPVDSDMSKMSEILAAAEARLRNFIRRNRAKDERWNAVHLLGYWELERLRAGEVEQQGRNTRLFLRQSGVPMTDEGATLWLPHFHAIVELGEVMREEFTRALRGYGHHAAYQVDLKPFDLTKPVEENLKDIIRYANKFRLEEDYKGKPVVLGDALDEYPVFSRSWWSQEEIRAYAEWLCEENRGFQSMRFHIGKKRLDEVVDVEVLDVVEECQAARYNKLVQILTGHPDSINQFAAATAMPRDAAELFDFGQCRVQTEDGFEYVQSDRFRSNPVPTKVTSEMLHAAFARVHQRHA